MINPSGFIPKTLRIFSRDTETFKMDAMWGSGWWYKNRSEIVHEIKGRKGFAVDAESKTSSDTASHWAKATRWVWEGQRYVEAFLKTDGPIYEEVPNDPISNLRVIQLEHRGNGGRAYKVLTEDGYIYDLREDQLLEAMINNSVERGIIGGEWVWAVIGGQMKLVRVGSAQHQALVETTGKRDAKKVSVKDLTVGTIYGRSNGDIQVFCGFVSIPGEKAKLQMWWEPYSFQDRSEGQKLLEEDLYGFEEEWVGGTRSTTSRRKCRHFKVTSSHSCKTEEGTLELPPDLIEVVRGVWEEQALQYVTRYKEAVAEAKRHQWSRRLVDPSHYFGLEKRTIFDLALVSPLGSETKPSPELTVAREFYQAEVKRYSSENSEKYAGVKRHSDEKYGRGPWGY